MLISHESPLGLLEYSKDYNDYDYALVHLFELEPLYLKYFEESIKTRIMYLDNSLFELGTAFDSEKFKEWCEHFCNINEKNFYYIVPDCWADKEKTIDNFKKFNFNKGKKIGVVQGVNFKELIECFKFMKDNCDIIALTFGLKCYFEEGDGFTPEEKYMNGRIKFINLLKKLNLIENTKIHLLGCYLPQEFQYYKNTPEIISLDTSNPIVHGIKGIKYEEHGLNTKIKTKFVDLLYYIGDNNYKIIFENIKMFRKINNLEMERD